MSDENIKTTVESDSKKAAPARESAASRSAGKTASKGSEKYEIIIHSRSESDGPFVDGGVNGRFYRIRRGVPVVVDASVLESLQVKEIRSRKEMEGNEEVMKYHEMPRHTVEVIRTVNA